MTETTKKILERNQTLIKELTSILIQRDSQIEEKTKKLKDLKDQHQTSTEDQALKLNQ